MIKHWSGAEFTGAKIVYNRTRWIIFSWNRKTRVVTLVNEDAWLCLKDPYFMQWEK